MSGALLSHCIDERIAPQDRRRRVADFCEQATYQYPHILNQRNSCMQKNGTQTATFTNIGQRYPDSNWDLCELQRDMLPLYRSNGPREFCETSRIITHLSDQAIDQHPRPWARQKESDIKGGTVEVLRYPDSNWAPLSEHHASRLERLWCCHTISQKLTASLFACVG